MPALVVDDLIFRWPRQSAPCLDIPHFDIAGGERVFLHGQSGSGKSTLLGLLGGVALPERGRIELLCTDITELSGRARDAFRADHIGFIFQQFNLLPWLSALDNVLLPRTFSARRRARAADSGAEAKRLLTHLDLAPHTLEGARRPAVRRAAATRRCRACPDRQAGNPDRRRTDLGTRCSATSNIRWDSFAALASHPAVDWAVPLALGDSHRSFPVLGTTADYFTRFRYAAGQPLAFRTGQPFSQIFEAVLGSAVASELGYRTGDRIALSHGLSGLGSEHEDKPFTVVGVLAATGTPLDRSVLVRLEAITAMLIGLKNRADVFRLQRHINGYRGEPLLAVTPGVALDELWQALASVERTLFALSDLVVLVGLAGLMATMLAGLNERRRELAILRSLDAGAPLAASKRRMEPKHS